MVDFQQRDNSGVGEVSPELQLCVSLSPEVAAFTVGSD